MQLFVERVGTETHGRRFVYMWWGQVPTTIWELQNCPHQYLTVYFNIGISYIKINCVTGGGKCLVCLNKHVFVIFLNGENECSFIYFWGREEGATWRASVVLQASK